MVHCHKITSSLESLWLCLSLIGKGFSKIDVKERGCGGGPWFCDDSTRALAIKSIDYGG